MGKTYFIDVDGTIVPHLSNRELDKIVQSGKSYIEELLPGVKELWNTFQEDDVIIITTARTEAHRLLTEKTLFTNNLRFDKLIMNLPSGPRYVINDTPDVTFPKAIAINVKRNEGFYFFNSANEEQP
jgi:hypothetical protein